MSKLALWIEHNGGTVKTGKLLGVARNSVYAWATGAAIPRPDLMQKIVRVSKGAVTYDDFIGIYVANRRKNALKRKGRTPTKGKARLAKKTKTTKPAKKTTKTTKTPKTLLTTTLAG